MDIEAKYYIEDLTAIVDNRGKMCVIENNNNIPFKIERLFYDFENRVGEETRGNHANINSRFVFICLKGSCVIEVDDGENRNVFVLNKPDKYLFVDKMVWKEMKNFSEDSVLLVLSDCKYDASEYIKNYNEFKERVKK